MAEAVPLRSDVAEGPLLFVCKQSGLGRLKPDKPGFSDKNYFFLVFSQVLYDFHKSIVHFSSELRIDNFFFSDYTKDNSSDIINNIINTPSSLPSQHRAEEKHHKFNETDYQKGRKSAMNSRERVLNAVAGKPVDRTPVGFWFHFPPECHNGKAAVDAHVRFWKESNTDILKIMTENLVPNDISIRRPSDWKQLKPFHRNSPFIVRQIDIVKRVLEQTGGEPAVLTTVHGIVASMWHAYTGPADYEERRGELAACLREDRDAFLYGMDVVCEAVCLLTEEMLGCGIDGIYYAALGGEASLFTEEEFSRFIAPRDLQILETAKNRTGFNVLHLCKDHLNLKRYTSYPCDVVNWGIYEDNPSLEEGKRLFPGKVILGGLDDRAGVLVDGPDSAIEEKVFSLLHEMKGTPFILGADCTLPTELPISHIRTAVEACRKYAQAGS